MDTKSKIRIGVATTIALSTGFAVGGAAPASASVCTPHGYYWTGNTHLGLSNSVINTGIVIPAPAPGEELKINDITYSVYDSSEVSRLDPPEVNEQLTVAIGGIQFGGTSADIPDDSANAFSTANFGGSLHPGGAFSTGGEIQIRAISSDSFFVTNVAVYTVLCAEPPSPTTAAPTTTTAAPTTTVAATIPPATTQPTIATLTTIAPPTTIAPTITIAPTTIAAVVAETTTTVNTGSGAGTADKPAAPQAAPKAQAKALPNAGSTTTPTLLIASLFVLMGAAMIAGRRRFNAM